MSIQDNLDVIELLQLLLPNGTGLPKWAIKLLDSTSDEMVHPPRDFVSVESRVVSRSYLDFLNEQIELQPRGPEWNTVLQNRLNALKEWIGESYKVISILHPPNHLSVYLLETLQLVILIESG